MTNEKEVMVTRWKVHRAITPFGLGGSELILDEIMKILGELENVNVDDGFICTLFGGLRSTDGQNGEGKEHI